MRARRGGAMGAGWLVRLFGLVAVVLFLGASGCGDDPALRPVSSSTVEVALGLLAGPLAPAPVGGGGACPAQPQGLPVATRVVVTLGTPGVAPKRHVADVPARTETVALRFDEVMPGDDYLVTVRVLALGGGDLMFSGNLVEQTVRPGGRQVLQVPLEPVGERVVMAFGAPEPAGEATFAVPVLVSHATEFRSLQFDVCLDRAVADVVQVETAGRGVVLTAVQHAVDDGPVRVLAYDPQSPGARVPVGRDAILTLTVRFAPAVAVGTPLDLRFEEAIVARSVDPADNLEVFFLDGSVSR